MPNLSSSTVSEQLAVDVTELSAPQRAQLKQVIISTVVGMTNAGAASPSASAFERGIELADKLSEVLPENSVLGLALWRLGASGNDMQRAIVALAARDGLVDRKVLLEITGRSEDERQPLNGVTRAINSVSHTLADEGLVGDDFQLTWPVWKRGTAVSFEANPVIISEAKQALAS